ncbi:MAG: hypothetical protein K2P80_16680, partial [Beijerinckiaceae bacterium]|nr:hypothetical protein [Beijerinckiaceae bacterium]
NPSGNTLSAAAWGHQCEGRRIVRDGGVAQHRPLPRACPVRRQIAEAVRTVATKLGNTPAICRSCYIHPEIMTAFADGHLARHMARVLEAEVEKHELRPEENAVLSLLAQRLRMQRALARQKAAGKIEGGPKGKPVRSRSPKAAPEWRAAA